ncbi:two-component system sensor histidine kinase NtrB [Psychrobacter sp. I-STPA6b]|uniref:two-component system sensor histidine kinase NtrB n=1 Tax=Psychrobacter sp. I-STPA6b TaxID=2585718 RepID=UPI001D0C0069|nr:ATP-binding protein [Psychrobacter sp. I-STPA6b]
MTDILSVSTQQKLTPAPISIHPIILRNLFTAVLWVDENLQICWVNTQAEQLLMVSLQKLQQQNILDILCPKPIDSASVDDSSHQQLAQQFAHAQQYQQSFIDHNQTISAIIKPILVDYSVTPVEQDRQHYFLIEIWEKNRHLRIDQEQRQQEQHDMARQMLRAVAHEVKNPLAGIRGATQLLNKYLSKQQSTQISPADSQKMLTYADIVISETDRLTQLIEQLLGSNKLPNWQLINIHEPLEHVLMLTQAQHPQIHIQRDYDLSLPELMADKDQLIQVFLNLTNNACQAMLENLDNLNNLDNLQYQPTLNISTRIEFLYTIGTVCHKKVLKISLQDNGSGIAPELIDKIFFPLVTGRANGTGLGLALVQDIIHRHNGTIEVDSKVGDTTFNIYLPLQQPANQSLI